MSMKNNQLVNKGLALLREGLLPFVEQKMTERYGSDWLVRPEVVSILKHQPRRRNVNTHLDTQALLNIIWNHWNEVFSYTLDQEERNLVSELRMTRNKIAHDESFSKDDAYRSLDSIMRLLKAIPAEGVTEVEQMKRELLSEIASLPNSTNEPINPVQAEQIPVEEIQPDVLTPTNNLSPLTGHSSDELKEFEQVHQEETLPNPSPPFEEPSPPHNSPGTKKFKHLLTVAICSVLALPVIGIGIKYIEFCLKPKLQRSSLTIGTLGSPEYQADLAYYLREQFAPNDFLKFLSGNKVKVIVEGDKELSYEEVRSRIALKKWDIAFTLSPMVSVAAKDNRYTFVARMFPNNPPYYYSGIFVKSDSYIHSLNDLKNTSVIALGDFGSASSFYMPTYDLFGKSLIVDMGHRGQDIIKMVKEGKADMGAAAIGDIVKEDDPEIRIIHKSREIPGAGVYISPNLSNLDQETLKKTILKAPKEIQKKANYGIGEEPNYSFFIGISQRSEEVLKCADFKKNPVNFFCSESQKNASKVIIGKVKEWQHQNSRIDSLTLASQDGKIYHVVISLQVRNQVPGASSLLALQGKTIKIISVSPQKLQDSTLELKITKPSQLVVL